MHAHTSPDMAIQASRLPTRQQCIQDLLQSDYDSELFYTQDNDSVFYTQDNDTNAYRYILLTIRWVYMH